MKRGQVTLLIIVGVILVAITAIVITYRDQLSEELQKAGLVKKEALDIEAEKITQEINTCLEELTGDAVLYAAANNKGLPELTEIEKSISYYMDQMIPFCVIGGEFDTQIEAAGNAKASAEITNEKTEVKVNYPIAVIFGDSSTTITNFNAEKNARIGLLYELAKGIETMHKGQTGVCFSCLFEIGFKNNLKIDIYNPEDAQETQFVMTDEETLINNMPLIFTFTIKLGETA